ncbi:tyrosine/serine protein phosphatase, partial [Colletotrichum orchidophilum]
PEEGPTSLIRFHSDAPDFCSTCQIVAAAPHPPFSNISHQGLPYHHTHSHPHLANLSPVRAVGIASLQLLTADCWSPQRSTQRSQNLEALNFWYGDLIAMDNRGITSVLNFRDVGSTVNKFLGRRLVREGLVFRSARPDDATLADRKRLREELGIKAVIDLRTKTEHVKQAKKREADLEAPALLESNAALAEPFQISGLTYHEIRITGGNFEWFLIRQVSWWGLCRLIFLFAFGYRNEGISILSREVMLPRGLVGLGLDTLDQSGEEIAKALRIFIDPKTSPTLVHCTQGKDRTGLIVSLVLFILDVPLEAIEHDYMLTSGALESEREERLAEMREIGLTDDWFETAPDMIARTGRHLDEVHGGLNGYLDKIGFGQADRLKLRELLLY